MVRKCVSNIVFHFSLLSGENVGISDGVPLTEQSTVLSTSLEKTFFAWRFILNENLLFWPTISYQKPFVFSISVFCSQIFTLKLNLRLKVGLTYAISTVKGFLEFLSKKIFFTSLC